MHILAVQIISFLPGADLSTVIPVEEQGNQRIRRLEKKMGISESIRCFLNSCRVERNLSPRTLKAYGGDLNHLNSFLGRKAIDRIGLEDLRNYLACLEERPLASTTKRRKLAVLKVFFQYLEDEGTIYESPARKIRGGYRIPKGIPRAIPSDELKKILRTIKSAVNQAGCTDSLCRFLAIRNRLIIELLLCTGMRTDELVRLNHTDVNLADGSLVVFGKGRKERALVVSPDEVLDQLRYYVAQRRRYAKDEGALILNRYGYRLQVHSIGPVFQRICKEAGLTRHYTPHCLRHTLATSLIENGADVRSVQEILGHSSISTTEIYLAVSSQRRKEVLKKYGPRNRLGLD